MYFFFYFSSYPDQRVKKDPDDLEMGVIGSVSLLQNATLSTQPITSFDWSPDKVSRADPENSERGAGTLATLQLSKWIIFILSRILLNRGP